MKDRVKEIILETLVYLPFAAFFWWLMWVWIKALLA